MAMKKGTVYADNLDVTNADGYKYILIGCATPFRCADADNVMYQLHSWCVDTVGNYKPPIERKRHLKIQIEKLAIGSSLSFWLYRHVGYDGKAITENMMADALKPFIVVRIS